MFNPGFLLAADFHCDSGYLLYGNFCYFFEIEDVKNWANAEAECVKEQGHLASFHSEEEFSFLIGERSDALRDSAWMGLRRQVSISWSDGWPVFFTQWGPGEPSNLQDEGCVSMHAAFPFHGTWNDTDCAVAKSYICKISYGTAPSVPGFDDPPRLTGLV
uniref:C-type lectin domain-containing protein n=1 Tax=Salarias fasciatus TaxID=181472 RepID=A0A672J823_SALFA